MPSLLTMDDLALPLQIKKTASLNSLMYAKFPSNMHPLPLISSTFSGLITLLISIIYSDSVCLTSQKFTEWGSGTNAGYLRFQRRRVAVPFIWWEMLRLHSICMYNLRNLVRHFLYGRDFSVIYGAHLSFIRDQL